MPGGETLHVLWGNPQATWHIDIAHELTNAGYAIERVLGGGRIYVNSKAKEVYFWDKSTRYGAAPRKEVMAVLSDAYTGHQIFEDIAPHTAKTLA